MKLPCLIIIAAFFASCSGEHGLQKQINSAIRSGQEEFVIPDGRYILDKPLNINHVKNFTIRSARPGAVIITSATVLELKDFTCLDSVRRIYEISLPELIAEPWPEAFRGYAGWPEVHIPGVQMRLARWPNDGYIEIDSVVSRGSIPRDGDSTGQGGAFISKSLTSNLLPPIDNIYLNGYWCYKWYDEAIKIWSVDRESGMVELSAPHMYGIGGPSGGLFYGINAPEFLDQPGEYYYDQKNGTIRMILPSLAAEETVVEISYKDFTLMEIRNSTSITIEGIKFANHNGLAVNIEDSDTVKIQTCRFSGLAQSAVNISGGTQCGLFASIIEHIGATGISLDGGDKTSLTPAGHYVVKCNIHNYAGHVKTYAPAVRLSGVGHYVADNFISDAPHNAILFSGNDHLIERNNIRRVCWDTSDAGAIYCGRDWTMGGTVIRKNDIRELGQASHHHNWAIYLDDLASGIDVLENVIEDSPSGILVGGGRYNRIIGNHIRNCDKASIMYDARGLNWYRPYLDDKEHTLWILLKKTPVDQPPWSERFPWLQEIENDDPALPKMAVIKSNIITESAVPDIHPSVIEYGETDLVK